MLRCFWAAFGAHRPLGALQGRKLACAGTGMQARTPERCTVRGFGKTEDHSFTGTGTTRNRDSHGVVIIVFLTYSICHLPLVPAELDPTQEVVGPSEETISFHSLSCRNEDHEYTLLGQ